MLEGAITAQGTENANRQELLGSLQYRLGQFSKAEAAFAKALELKPRQNAVGNNLALGRSRLAQGLLREALPPLQKAAETQANDACPDRPGGCHAAHGSGPDSQRRVGPGR